MANPYTSTREEFTRALTDGPMPEGPTSDWKSSRQNLCDMLKALAHHPAMAPNLPQTYMTPAASKNKVYFMWDFVGRTLVSLACFHN